MMPAPTSQSGGLQYRTVSSMRMNQGLERINRVSSCTYSSSFIYSFLTLVRQNPPPQALRPPDAGAETFKLHNLTVIHKQVHLRTIVLDVPGKDLRVSSLEHHLLQPQRANDFGYRIGSPCLHILGDALGLDHNHVGSRVQEAPGLSDCPFHVTCALSLQVLFGSGSPSTELDAYLWLGFEADLLHLLHQAQPVINRDGDKPAGDFEYIEPKIVALLDVAIHRLGPLCEHMLNESPGRNQHIVAMGKVDDLLEGFLGH